MTEQRPPARHTNEANAHRRLGRALSERGVPSQRYSSMADSRGSSQGSRQFMFIDRDANRGTSGEAIRVHVMRESHRARRQLRGLMQSSEGHGQMTIFPSITPPLTRQQTRSQETSGDDSAEHASSTAIEDMPRPLHSAPLGIAELKQVAQQRLSSILTTTSASVVTATPAFRILQDLPENIVDLCDGDTAAIHALLALIHSVQKSVSLLQAAQYESSALEALRSRLAEAASAEHSDETITTVLLLSRLEVSLSYR